ncbi:hypothetical protein N665_0057s0037 [Sinapis alba]|nr:hypothetical protein N665_0057s0037 [Sinapis alba]
MEDCSVIGFSVVTVLLEADSRMWLWGQLAPVGIDYIYPDRPI